MITELIASPKIVPAGTWRLTFRRAAAGSPEPVITAQGRLHAGPKTRVWTGASEEELRAFAATLPREKTASENAADFFRALPGEVQEQFETIFRIVSSLKSDTDKATLIAAIAVPPELEPARDRLIELLTA